MTNEKSRPRAAINVLLSLGYIWLREHAAAVNCYPQSAADMRDNQHGLARLASLRMRSWTSCQVSGRQPCAQRRTVSQVSVGQSGGRQSPPVPYAPRVQAAHASDRNQWAHQRDVHLILDNYATHKTPDVQAWLEKHPRFKLHFTPTSVSWLNLVERSFAEITSRRIRRGSYSSVDDLEAAIYDYLAHHNEKPKPFKWTRTAEDILARERRALDALDEIRGNR